MRKATGAVALLVLTALPRGELHTQSLPRAAYCDVRREATAPRLHVRSMLPALRQWSEQTRGLSASARRDAFRRIVLQPEGNLFGSIFRRPSDETLDEYFEWVVPRLAAVFALGTQVDTLLEQTAARMAALFPELATQPVDVIVGVTLGRSNGTVRLRDGAPTLILGLDVQTFVSEQASMTAALIEHELAHVAHARANPGVYDAVDRSIRGIEGPLYLSLFSEGLAVWASSCASPARTMEELMSSATLASAGQAVWSDAAPKLARVLESTSPDTVAAWFHMGVNPVGHPERFAYWAGARVAAAMVCARDAAALLRLSEPEILRDVRAILEHPDAALSPARCGERRDPSSGTSDVTRSR
jgi:hypothetical protein